MSIKPVDMQVMIPKTSEISRIRNDEQNRNLATSQQQASSTQDKVNVSLKQVYSQDKANEALIREKQEKKEGGKEQEKKKNTEKKDKNKDMKSVDKTYKTSTIDIKI